MSVTISELPVGVIKTILDYSVFLEQEQLEKTIDNLMLEVIEASSFPRMRIVKFNISKIITKSTELSKNFGSYINVIGNLFGHVSIIDNPVCEIYKGPFLLRELSLVAYQNFYSNFNSVRHSGIKHIPHFLLHDLLHNNNDGEFEEECITAIASLNKNMLPNVSELNKSLIVPYYSAASLNLRKCYYTLEKLQNLLLQPLVKDPDGNLDGFLEDPITELAKITI